MYGDIWYMPGKKTLVSAILEDLKVNYLWSEYPKKLAPLSFEEVLRKAKNCDYWINLSDFENAEELASNDKRYTWFEAYQKKNMYAATKRKSKNGGNDFFETGLVKPNLILKDLAKIFYPEHFSKHELYFYKKLE